MELNAITRFQSYVDLRSQLASAAAWEPRPTSGTMTLVRFIVRILRRFWKGFLVGFSVKSLFAVFSVLLKMLRGNVGAIKSLISIFRLSSAPVQFGTFTGSFLSIFELMMRAQRHFLKQQSVSSRATISGVVAGVSLLALPQDSRWTFVLFFVVRAFEVLMREIGAKYEKRWAHFDANPNPKNRPIVPRWVIQFQHWDTVLMMVASSQVLYSYVHHIESLEPSCQWEIHRDFSPVF